MLIVEVVVAVVVGVFLVGVYRDAKNGTLPLQNSVGIKTPATMSSEDTWNRIHKQYAPIFLVDACALFLIALEIIIGGAMEKSFGRTSLNAISKVHRAFARAQVSANLSSALNQGGQLPIILAENGAQQLILGHLSRENNTPRAALDAVSQALTDAGFLPGEPPELYAAPADTPLVLAAGKACVCCR